MPYKVSVRTADPAMALMPLPLHALTIPPPVCLAAASSTARQPSFRLCRLLDFQRFGRTGEQESEEDGGKDCQQREVDPGEVAQVSQQGRAGQE
jgi:hypothetical protein